MRFRQSLKQVLVWSYERGTWQYDIICALILAFIFFTPQKLFNTERIDKKILAYSNAIAIIQEGKQVGKVNREEESIREKRD